MDKIVGIGNVLVDALITLDNDRLLETMNLPKGSMQLIDETELLRIKEMFPAMRPRRATGGSVCNAMLALANMGMKPGIIGMIGKDEAGAFFRNNALEHGIDIRLQESEKPSGVALTFISPDGQRTFATCLGAAALMSAADVQAGMLHGYRYLFVEGYLARDHELTEHVCRLARQEGMKICYDLASYNIVEADRDFIARMADKYVDIVFANEEEAKAFAQASPGQAANDLGSCCETAVIKLGARGAMIRQGGKTIRVDAMKVQKVTDTTAAGDFFAAGFMYGYLHGASLEKCGRIGSILAGHVIQTIGTVLPEETWHEIKLNVDTILSE